MLFKGLAGVGPRGATRLGAVALLALAASGCAEPLVNQKKQVETRYVTPVSVCQMKLAAVGNSNAVRDLEPGQWLEAMVPGYQESVGVDPTAQDCTGNYVFANESLRSGASDRGWPRVVDPDEVVINSGANGMRIVWLRALKFTNGDEGGPIALSRAYGDTAEIYGMGSFRGPRDTRFQTARLGNETIVVAETRECDAETETCRKRAVFFLPRAGRLIESASVDIERTAVVPSTTQRGLYTQYRLTTDVTYAKDGILLLEQMSVRLVKNESPDLDSDRELRTVEFQRFLKVERDTMFSSNEPLWERVVGRD